MTSCLAKNNIALNVAFHATFSFNKDFWPGSGKEVRAILDHVFRKLLLSLSVSVRMHSNLIEFRSEPFDKFLISVPNIVLVLFGQL